jgi:RTX calcium-binding nonapeptide repeat (4 copies)
MAVTRPGVRRALGLNGGAVAGLALLAVCCTPAAVARTRCDYSGPPDNVLTVTADRGALTEVARRGQRIIAREFLELPVRCRGDMPTVLNTDTIEIKLRTDEDSVDVLLAGGSFAPGATPEPEGASEIEIDIEWQSRFAFLGTVQGTRRADEFHWGPGLDRQPGLNLNPLEAGDADVDVTAHGGFDPLLTVEGGGGDDTIIPAPGPKFPNLGVFTEGGPGDDRLAGFPNSGAILVGDEGNDVLTGGRGMDDLRGLSGRDRLDGRGGADLIDGGRGRDLIFGGPGRDRILARDSWRDKLRCGAGRDRVRPDRRDRLRGCEVVVR